MSDAENVANLPHSLTPQSQPVPQQTRGDMGDSTFSIAPSPANSPVVRSPPNPPSKNTQVSQRVSAHHVHTNAVPNPPRFVQESTDSATSRRFPRPRTDPSKTSTTSSFALSRMPSNVNSLRESFFGVIGRRPSTNDPLKLSPTQEFNLDVIDESGGKIHETIGQILKPRGDFTTWTTEGYAVVGFGCTLLLPMLVLTETTTSLNGYNIDPGLVFGSLLTLLLCACVFVTYHAVQRFQRHPNPLIYYKCVIDMCLALRFLADPLLLEMGVYKANDERSCAYLSGVTQFLFLSSDCWYFALIIDQYWSLTNPFMSVKANRRRFKILVYVIGASTGLLAASVPSIHGFADGNYCWTRRKTTRSGDRDFYRLNKGSWLLFYMWMILFYLSGIAVLAFGMKRLRSGLRDTLQSRRDMLRDGVLFITSYTIYWTIVFIWYALSFQRRSRYDRNGQFAPSHVFRTFTFTLTARGAVDYFVWFTVNKPGLIRTNWLQFTPDSADKEFSAQLNTTLQEELIYFTIEGMTRAIQSAEDELRQRQAKQGSSEDELCEPHEQGRDTDRDSDSKYWHLLRSAQHIRMLTTIQEVITTGLRRASSADAEARATKPKNSRERDVSFDIPAEQRPTTTHVSNAEEARLNPSTTDDSTDAQGVQIHHRFDIKGSWINRSYKRPRRGAKVKCRHCSMLFKYGAKTHVLQCPNVVGHHEPNVVLKDNDLRTRMRIGTDEGVALYDQLRADSLFLCDMGIMDYSLLLGVVDIEFVVEQRSRDLQLDRTHARTCGRTATETGTTLSSSGYTTDSAMSLHSSALNDTFSSTSSSSTKPLSSHAGTFLSMRPKTVTPSVHSLGPASYERNFDQSRRPSTGTTPRPKCSMRQSQRVFGPGYYYVGIIDILQTWTLAKKLERFWKVQIQRKDGAGLSAIDPVQYQRRFESKLREIIAIPKEVGHESRPREATMRESMHRLSPVLQAAAAFEMAGTVQRRVRAHSNEGSPSSTSAIDEEDLEQAGRNPEPILLPFNQRLINRSSTRVSTVDVAV
ncbi:hypothetical protein PsorP6_015749 [Peronosclerospora sorghi]|uniref:Uncharacterized protein n=1 Tax=Peronosclerospora sorghi TaxID=230839 RepID=A0ACC0WNN0_9STRA|nr:hypothetical protein PsorP6_015749 [Peronosclerospora sorghi]